MKKSLKIILNILPVIIISLGIVYILNRIIYSSYIKDYINRKTFSKVIDFTENNSIELDDLTISLESLKYYPEGNDEYPTGVEGEDNNLLLTTIKFSNETNLPVVIKSLQYLIFDKKNNILAADYHSENGLKYMKGFLYEKYSETSYENIPDHMVSIGREKDNITQDISIVSKTFATNLKSSPKQLTIRLFDLEYSINSQPAKSLGLDDIEFVIKFN